MYACHKLSRFGISERLKVQLPLLASKALGKQPFFPGVILLTNFTGVEASGIRARIPG